MHILAIIWRLIKRFCSYGLLSLGLKWLENSVHDGNRYQKPKLQFLQAEALVKSGDADNADIAFGILEQV